MRKQPRSVRAVALGFSLYNVHATERFWSAKAAAASDTKGHLCVCACLHVYMLLAFTP